MSLGADIPADEDIVRNLQEQLQLTNQVREMKRLCCFVSLVVPWRIGGSCFTSWLRIHLFRVS